MALLAAFPPGPLPEGAAEMARVTRWTAAWGRAGDAGVVAWAGGTRVGAAWCRIHDESTVSDEEGKALPELAIAVVPDERSAGVGGALLRALELQAVEAGLQRLGLTVNAANPALRLYEREGYCSIRRDGATLTMGKRIGVSGK